MINHYYKLLLEDIEKLKDTCINVISEPEIAKKYQGWIDQFKAGKITDKAFIRWLDILADYWGPKDRSYSQYIKSLFNQKEG